MNIIKNY